MRLYSSVVINAALLLTSISLASASTGAQLTSTFGSDTIQRQLRIHSINESEDEERKGFLDVTFKDVLSELPGNHFEAVKDLVHVEPGEFLYSSKENRVNAFKRVFLSPEFETSLRGELPPTISDEDLDTLAYLLLVKASGDTKPFMKAAEMIQAATAPRDANEFAKRLERAQFNIWKTWAANTKMAAPPFLGTRNPTNDVGTVWKKKVLEKFGRFLNERPAHGTEK